MIKVLAVDDELPIREWLKFSVSRLADYECCTALDGEDGLNCFINECPDIVISDIEMPKMDGIEMLSHIRNINHDTHFIVLTSHSDFTYARDALALGVDSYILKTEMIEETLHELLKRVETRILAERHQKDNLMKSAEHYLYTIIKKGSEAKINLAELTENKVHLGNNSIISIHFRVQKDINLATLDSIQFLHHCIKLENNEYVYLIGLENEIERHVLILLCNNLCDETIVSCGISDLYNNPVHIAKAFSQAQFRSNMIFYKKEKVCVNGYPVDFSHYEEHFMLDHMKSLLDQNYALVFDCVQKFFQNIRTYMPGDIKSIKKTLKTAGLSFLSFTKESEIEMNNTIEKYKTSLISSSHIDELQNIVETIYAPMSKIGQYKSFTYEILSALKYIEHNYAEKITLNDVAHEVHFSPEHLSRIFSKEMGISFGTYLNNLRMKHAVILLESTHKKIQVIAEEVGFSSTGYFSTSFKKKFGQNPYEYQINIRKKKSDVNVS